MATRSIVTSQPDVECDVCERRLLRGEQPDVFLDAGQPRMVCELCAPRAAHQGWKRGSEEQLIGAASLTSRRGRGLLGRLRQSRRVEAPRERSGLEIADDAQPFDLLGRGADAGGALDLTRDGLGASVVAAGVAGDFRKSIAEPLSTEEALLIGAIDAFNASEYTRRVASLARSLGAAEVTVRPGVAVASSVVIVLAWELCWYSYEVDLDDMQGVEVRAIGQGTELSELSAEDRLANALADERGSLALR
jgi:hypothetical protein